MLTKRKSYYSYRKVSKLQTMSLRLGNYQFATWKLLVCDLETRPLDYQPFTKALEKAKILVNILYKTDRVYLLKLCVSVIRRRRPIHGFHLFQQVCQSF